MQDSHLKLKVDGKPLAVTNLSFSHSLGNSVGAFEAEVHSKEFVSLKGKLGKQVEIILGSFKRYCLLEQLSYEPQKDLRIGGRDLISIMLDSTAKPNSYADGLMFNSLAKSICDRFGFKYRGYKDKKLEGCVVNKGESYLGFLERYASPWVLTTKYGNDLKIIQEAGNMEIKEGFKLTGLEYNRDISDVYESYELVDTSHSWMTGWKKSVGRKVNGSGPKGKQKLFFNESIDLQSELENRESNALSITMTVDKVFNAQPGSILKVDILGVKGDFKTKSITLETSPSSINTQIVGVKI